MNTTPVPDVYAAPLCGGGNPGGENGGRHSSGQATFSLVFGILALVTLVFGILALVTFFTLIGGIVLGTVAVISGHRALSRMKQSGIRRGSGIAVAGLVTGYTGLLGSMFLVFAAFQFSSDMSGRRTTVAEARIGTLTSYLQIYSAKNGGKAPSNASGLRALMIKRILLDESLLTDSWGEPVQYAVPGRRSKDKFDVWSKGPDKISGNGDDVGNWISR